LTAGGPNFNDFAENQLTCAPKNISFRKSWGQNTMFDPQVNFWGHLTPWLPGFHSAVAWCWLQESRQIRQ